MTPDEPLKKFEEAVSNVLRHQIAGGFDGNTPVQNEAKAIAALRQAAINYGDERVRAAQQKQLAARVAELRALHRFTDKEADHLVDEEIDNRVEIHEITLAALQPKPEEGKANENNNI